MQKSPTILVTEYAGALEDGAVVNFVKVDNLLKYELSLANAQKHGVVVGLTLQQPGPSRGGMTMARLLSIALFTLLTMASAIAQTDPLVEALRRYQGGELQAGSYLDR